MSTRLWTVVGGGGVGKTTTSAALGMCLARAGRRTLVVTVDPARRLADALGVRLDVRATRVCVDGVELEARMPDARASVDHFVDWLWLDPAARDRVRANPMYQELGNALAGVHEMVSLAVVENDLASGRFDDVVLDTAPSRHALELFDYPAKLVKMLDERTLRFMIGLSRLAGAALEERPDESRLFSWGKRRAGSLVSQLVGQTAIVNIAALFVELETARERWLALVENVERRLAHPSTRYVVIAAPSGAALDDAAYLSAELLRRRLKPSALLLNRTRMTPTAWPALGAGDPLAPLIDLLAKEERQAVKQAQLALERVQSLPGAKRIIHTLPAVDDVDPARVLSTLSGCLAQQPWVLAP
ncbi:MAG: ArsA-related P-loop ATPase [Polyangiaceae bacterium]